MDMAEDTELDELATRLSETRRMALIDGALLLGEVAVAARDVARCNARCVHSVPRDSKLGTLLVALDRANLLDTGELARLRCGS